MIEKMPVILEQVDLEDAKKESPGLRRPKSGLAKSLNIIAVKNDNSDSLELVF